MNITQMEQLLFNFGYTALLFGAALEGEAILLTAAFLAYKKIFSIKFVILFACIGTATADHLAFFFGFYRGRTILARHARLQHRFLQVEPFINSHRYKLLFVYRYLYGFRTIIPFAAGMAKTPPAIFIPINLLMTFVWAVSIVSAGYFTGEGVNRMLLNCRGYQFTGCAIIIIVCMAVAIRRQYRK